MKPATAMVLAFLSTRGLDGATEAEIQAATTIRSGGQRVHELKAEGYDIVTVLERSDIGARYARWFLNDSPQPAASLSPDAAGTPYDRDGVGQPLAVQPSAPESSRIGAEGAPLWTCVDCHGIPASEVEDRLGGMGWAYCRTCEGRRYFRRRAAA